MLCASAMKGIRTESYAKLNNYKQQPQLRCRKYRKNVASLKNVAKYCKNISIKISKILHLCAQCPMVLIIPQRLNFDCPSQLQTKTTAAI